MNPHIKQTYFLNSDCCVILLLLKSKHRHQTWTKPSLHLVPPTFFAKQSIIFQEESIHQYVHSNPWVVSTYFLAVQMVLISLMLIINPTLITLVLGGP